MPAKANYAATTAVPVEKSRSEIEATLRRYGADAFGYSQDGRAVKIAFRMKDRHFRFELQLPDPVATEFVMVNQGARGAQPRSVAGAQAAWEQACRQKWRALALVIKAKLEAVDAGIVTMGDEFLAQTVLPNRETVAEWLRPQVEEAYRIGSMPATLALEGPRG